MLIDDGWVGMKGKSWKGMRFGRGNVRVME